MFEEQERVAETWWELFVSRGFRDPLKVPFPKTTSYANSGATVHIDNDCTANRSTMLYKTTTERSAVTCKRCLSVLSRNPASHLFWAAQLVKGLFEERRYHGKLMKKDRGFAHDAFLTRQLATQIRKKAVKSPKGYQLRVLADCLDSEIPLLNADYYTVWHDRFGIAAALWCAKDVNSRSSGNFTSSEVMPVPKIDVHIPYTLYLEQSPDVIQGRKALGAGGGFGAIDVVSNWVSIVEHLSRQCRFGVDYGETVTRLTRASFINKGDEANKFTTLYCLPEKFHFAREDYATTVDWACAEINHRVGQDLDVQVSAAKDQLLSYGPGRERMWVTVQMPKKLKQSKEYAWEVASWYSHAATRQGMAVQVPFPVLVMLVRMTNTNLAAWNPTCVDAEGNSVLEAMLAMLADTTRYVSLVKVYDDACVVTGADPGQVYGTPDLSLNEK